MKVNYDISVELTPEEEALLQKCEEQYLRIHSGLDEEQDEEFNHSKED